jgi:hypothetical protein
LIESMESDRRNTLNPQRLVIILGLVALMATSASACGSDDDEPKKASDAGGEAVAPPPATAFNDLTTALEGQGLTVTRVEKGSLDGAEAGVDIKGDKSGSARSFATASEAKDYADEASKDGDKTTIVGTVAFRAGTQTDADFFAQAYEG